MSTLTWTDWSDRARQRVQSFFCKVFRTLDYESGEAWLAFPVDGLELARAADYLF